MKIDKDSLVLTGLESTSSVRDYFSSIGSTKGQILTGFISSVIVVGVVKLFSVLFDNHWSILILAPILILMTFVVGIIVSKYLQYLGMYRILSDTQIKRHSQQPGNSSGLALQMLNYTHDINSFEKNKSIWVKRYDWVIDRYSNPLKEIEVILNGVANVTVATTKSFSNSSYLNRLLVGAHSCLYLFPCNDDTADSYNKCNS